MATKTLVSPQYNLHRLTDSKRHTCNDSFLHQWHSVASWRDLKVHTGHRTAFTKKLNGYHTCRLLLHAWRQVKRCLQIAASCCLARGWYVAKSPCRLFWLCRPVKHIVMVTMNTSSQHKLNPWTSLQNESRITQWHNNSNYIQLHWQFLTQQTDGTIYELYRLLAPIGRS